MPLELMIFDAMPSRKLTIVSFFARRAAGVTSVADQISDDFGLRVVLGFDELAIGRLNDAFKNRFCLPWSRMV